MNLRETLQAARDAVSAKQVFGEPVERHGVTVIPAASVLGGGGGSGADDATRREGQPPEPGGGFGFGLWGRPVGAIEITERGIEWKPAPLDLTGVLMVGLMFAAPAVLAAWLRHRETDEIPLGIVELSQARSRSTPLECCSSTRPVPMGPRPRLGGPA